MTQREMYSEIGALIGAVAQAFSITEAEAIAAAEQNRLAMEFGRDAKILLVGEDQSLVRTTLVELLPDSFGPIFHS